VSEENGWLPDHDRNSLETIRSFLILILFFRC
jgi:hypothetical protein